MEFYLLDKEYFLDYISESWGIIDVNYQFICYNLANITYIIFILVIFVFIFKSIKKIWRWF